MAAKITLVSLIWDGVVDATGYEIKVDGTAVATAGGKARTTKVSVGNDTFIEILDLPKRSVSQGVRVTQVDGS